MIFNGENLSQKDNAPSHPAENEPDKNGILEILLLPNVTFLIQPMDQVIFKYWVDAKVRPVFGIKYNYIAKR